MGECNNAPCINMELNINGFDLNARFFKKDIDKIFLPLLKTLFEMKKKKDGRLIVYLAAPPGTGKTALSLFLSRLSETVQNNIIIQSVGIDGFHYPQEYIEKHSVIKNSKAIPMRDVKGSPETFDLNKLTGAVKRLRSNDMKWPVYDRNLHDVVQDAVLVQSEIVIIEGNWLLLNEAGWNGLQPLCDYSIFITAGENMLKDRLIQRKILGGLSPDRASAFYDKSDRLNIARALKNRLTSDCELNLATNGKYSRIK